MLSNTDKEAVKSSTTMITASRPVANLLDIRTQIFSTKLAAILDEPRFSHILSWMPHGRAWRILSPHKFEDEVAPHYFEYPNYHSFQRLVNAWGFRRIKNGRDVNAYYHELFLRGMPHLHSQMRRIKGRNQYLGSFPEPDFYKLPPVISLHDPPPQAVRQESEKRLSLQNINSNHTRALSPGGLKDTHACVPNFQEKLNVSKKVPAKTPSKPTHQLLVVPQAMQELSSDQEDFVETQARQGSMEALQKTAQTQHEFLKLLKRIKSQLSTEDCVAEGGVPGRASDVASSIASQSQRPTRHENSDYSSLLEQAMRLRVPSELDFLARIPNIRSTASIPHQDQSPVERPRYSLNSSFPLLTSPREAFTESQTVLQMLQNTGQHLQSRLPLISSIQPRSNIFSTEEVESQGIHDV